MMILSAGDQKSYTKIYFSPRVSRMVFSIMVWNCNACDFLKEFFSESLEKTATGWQAVSRCIFSHWQNIPSAFISSRCALMPNFLEVQIHSSGSEKPYHLEQKVTGLFLCWLLTKLSSAEMLRLQFTEGENWFYWESLRFISAIKRRLCVSWA